MFIDLNCFLRWAMWPIGFLLWNIIDKHFLSFSEEGRNFSVHTIRPFAHSSTGSKSPNEYMIIVLTADSFIPKGIKIHISSWYNIFSFFRFLKYLRYRNLYVNYQIPVIEIWNECFSWIRSNLQGWWRVGGENWEAKYH